MLRVRSALVLVQITPCLSPIQAMSVGRLKTMLLQNDANLVPQQYALSGSNIMKDSELKFYQRGWRIFK
jgi:hypothetical protein